MSLSIPDPAVANPPNLAELAETINREHVLAARSGESLLRHAVAAGEALIEARLLVPNKEWMKWLAANVEMHQGTIYKYVRLAHYKDRIADLTHIEAANEALIGLPAATKLRSIEDRPEYEQVKDLLAAGFTQRQIAREMGVSTTVIVKLANPDAFRARKKRYLEESRERIEYARKAREREARDAEARKAGGGISECYSRLRLLAESLDALARTGETQEIRKVANFALRKVYRAQDELVTLLGSV